MLCTLQMVVIRILVTGISLSFYNLNKFNFTSSLWGDDGALVRGKIK